MISSREPDLEGVIYDPVAIAAVKDLINEVYVALHDADVFEQPVPDTKPQVNYTFMAVPTSIQMQMMSNLIEAMTELHDGFKGKT